MTEPKILIVDDERNIRRSLDIILSGEGYRVTCASSGQEGIEALRHETAEVVLLDIVMPGMNGIEVLQKMRQAKPNLAIIMISGRGTFQDAVQAIKLGAYDFLEKPLSREKVLLAISHAKKTTKLTKENRTLREQIEGRFEMIGKSRAIEEIKEQIKKVAPTSGRVLIMGDSGTGKELIARDIHRNSRRSSNPFIKVNCAAIPDELIESELFGSDRGAFTGAVKTRDGKFLMADGGTLFLDEIGDMSLNVQAKVLRALEQGEFERVGGNQTIRINVRIIAATNKPLHQEVEQGRFREDLYFRLNVVPIIAPPLRNRREDIPILVNHFLTLYAQDNGFRPKNIATKAIDLLCSYDWPGNIRELKNLLERLSIMVVNETIQPNDLPNLNGLNLKRQNYNMDLSTLLMSGKTLREIRENTERIFISEALEKTNWNVTRSARTLGIERTNLHKKIKYYNIERYTDLR